MTADLVSIQPEPLGPTYQRHAAQFARAFAAVPNNRNYASDETSERGGVAFARAVWGTIRAAGARDDDTLDKLLKQVAPLVRTAVQSWRPPAEPPIPPLWTDPWGRVLSSPFDGKTPDLEGQSILLQRDPALAELLQGLAKSPYQLVANMRDAQKQRAILREIEFTKADFANDPFRRNPNEPGAMEAQNMFVAQYSSPIVEVWRQEAHPVRWPWGMDGNMSELGGCVNALRGATVINESVFMLARKIDSDLLDAQRGEVADAAAAAVARARQLAAPRR